MKTDTILRVVLGVAVFSSVYSSFARECDSNVKAALKPLDEDSPILWATELTLRFGSAKSDGYKKDFNNQMLLLGVEYQASENILFYGEGGIKLWNKTGPGCDGDGPSRSGDGNCPVVDGDWSTKRHAGLRELFAEYADDGSVIRAGLQEMTAGDRILLDERVLGIFGSSRFSVFSLNAGVGTVSRDFSMQGSFCASRHNYRPLYPYLEDEIGADLGKNNLVFASLAWEPSFQDDMSFVSVEGDDEFMSFEPMDAQNSGASADTLFALNRVGTVFLHQFGDGFSNDVSFAGVFMNCTLPFQLGLSAEGLAQFAEDSNILVGWVDVDRMFDFGGAGTTVLRGGCLGHTGSEEDRYQPAYDNLFIGDAIKMNGIDAPLWFGNATHTVPFKWPVSFGVSYVSQISDNKAREFDAEIGLQPYADSHTGNVYWFHNLKCFVRYGRVDADNVDGTLDIVKLETRWAF